ncbi:hypothetical protein BKA57DRAFT_445286 [Linnemannia elongata]|nr:hypothetical protein BKA57DRAFT_445286 [Linnemannia elongata]
MMLLLLLLLLLLLSSFMLRIMILAFICLTTNSSYCLWVIRRLFPFSSCSDSLYRLSKPVNDGPTFKRAATSHPTGKQS